MIGRFPPRKCHILITLGPTWEFIDPIRFITNRATGTLGYLIAREGLRRGYRLTCISGPTSFSPLPGTHWVNVVSAEEMCRAVATLFPKVDVLVMSAAVSDYRVERPFSSKLKRGKKRFSLSLRQNRDILGEINRTRKHQILVGFALETENFLKHALRKLKRKRLDLLIANRVGKEEHPFGDRKVTVHFLWEDGRRKILRNILKQRLAKILLDAIQELIVAKHSAKGGANPSMAR